MPLCTGVPRERPHRGRGEEVRRGVARPVPRAHPRRDVRPDWPRGSHFHALHAAAGELCLSLSFGSNPIFLLFFFQPIFGRFRLLFEFLSFKIENRVAPSNVKAAFSKDFATINIIIIIYCMIRCL